MLDILENVIMHIFLLNKYIKNMKIKYLKEVFKKFGGLKHGKIFIQNIIQKKINIGILIKLKQIHQKLLLIIKGNLVMKK